MAVAGVAAAVVSGLANGSWNLPTKADAPNVICAVRGDWQWENIWFVANLMMPCVNTAVVVGVVGPSTLRDVYAAARPSEIGSVIAFSILWGFGGVGFGQAIKRIGVALGTSVVMGIIVVIGTALPAVTSKLSVVQASGTAVGVLLGILGFTAGSKAGSLREAAKSTKYDSADGDAEDGSKDAQDGTRTMKEAEGGEEGAAAGNGFFGSMLWCLVGGVLSSMLQFAFVFGGNLVDLAEQAGVSKTAAAMPIWLLCFIFNAVGHLSYSSYLLLVNGSWRAFATTPLRESLHAGCLCLAMAVGMPFHIHTYGIGAVLLGETGAVFAWPVVMSSTVLTAQVWSVALREWKGAPEAATRANLASLALLVSSVVVVAVTGMV